MLDTDKQAITVDKLGSLDVCGMLDTDKQAITVDTLGELGRLTHAGY